IKRGRGYRRTTSCQSRSVRRGVIELEVTDRRVRTASEREAKSCSKVENAHLTCGRVLGCKTQADRSLQAASASSVSARVDSLHRVGHFQDAICLRTRRAIWIPKRRPDAEAA